MSTILEALQAAFNYACSKNDNQELIDQLDEAISLANSLNEVP